MVDIASFRPVRATWWDSQNTPLTCHFPKPKVTEVGQFGFPYNAFTPSPKTDFKNACQLKRVWAPRSHCSIWLRCRTWLCPVPWKTSRHMQLETSCSHTFTIFFFFFFLFTFILRALVFLPAGLSVSVRSWGCWQLWAAMWLLGFEYVSSGRVVSAPIHWPISPAPLLLSSEAGSTLGKNPARSLVSTCEAFQGSFQLVISYSILWLLSMVPLLLV